MVEVRTIFDQSVSFTLLKFQLRKIRILLIVIAALFALIGVMLLAFGGEDRFLGVFLIVCAVLYYPAVLLLSKSMQKNMNKSLKIMTNETHSFFRFDSFKVFQETTRGTEFRTMTEQTYSTFHKAFETDSHFFVYVSNMQAHVIPKKDIVTGSAAELSALLSAALGKSFRRINTK